jgi:ubiquinone/menaquinone biosynthesis C-methylase UbiE
MEWKQTWWDKNLDKRYAEFESWVGPKSSVSKVFFRNYIKDKGYKHLVDLGCGNATEYFGYKEDYPELQYTGVDSSLILYNRNVALGISMIYAPADNVGVEDNFFEVGFSRHVLEHQPDFKPVLNELIRISEKEAIHVFFIIPKDIPEHIGFDSTENLYHNRYNKQDIELFLKEHPKVKNFRWIPITTSENAISITF